MTVELLQNVLGYVRFSVKGEFPERLINQLAANGASVWGIRRRGERLTACMFCRDYLKIHQYKAQNRVATRIISRHGLPFALKKYRLRVGFAAGLILYFAVLVFLSSFVWNVRVVGNEALTEAEVLAACEGLGLKEGAFKASLDPTELKTRLALSLDGVAWASVNIEGVRATVNISEISGVKNPPTENCNLVAEKDGVITALRVTNGDIKVKVGQTVKKGQLLVSGITEYKDGTYIFGASAGEVIAETDRELTVFVPFEQKTTVSAGEPKKKRVLTVFGVNIPLYLGSVKGEYKTESKLLRYSNGEMYLPVSVTETKFFPLKTETAVISAEQATALAHKQLEKLQKKEFENAEIQSKTVKVISSADGVTLKAEFILRENIAKTDLLLILEEK